MKPRFFIIILLLSSISLSGQSQLLDSIRHEIKTADNDSIKQYFHTRMIWYSLSYHPDTVEHYLLQAKDLNKQLQDPKMTIRLKRYHGLLHRIRGEYAAAIDTFRQVVDYFESKGDSSMASGAIFNLGVLHSYIGAYEKSLSYYLKDLRIHEKNGNIRSVANAWNSIGLIHKNQGNLEEALNCYNKSLAIYEKEAEDPGMLANVYHNIGSVLIMKKDFDGAVAFEQKSYEIDQELERNWGIGHSLNNLGIVARERGNFEKAAQLSREAIEIWESLEQKQELSNAYLNYGEIFLDQKKYYQAEAQIKQSLSIAESLNYIPGMQQAYAALASVYEARGDYKAAFDMQSLSHIYQDSLVNTERIKTIENLEIQYEVEKQEERFSRLSLENQLQIKVNKRIQQSQIAWTIAALLFAALLILSIYWYRRQLKQGQNIADKERALNQSKIAQLEQAQQVLTLNAMISGQEEERKRIAKDLHDSLGSLLTTIKLNFKVLQRKRQEKDTTELYEKANGLIDFASKEVRRISHDMMPDVLNISLTEGIRELLQQIEEHTSIQVNFQNFGTEPANLEDHQKVMVYRIAQELTQNIIKHAEAKQVHFQLSWLAEQLQMLVRDDGKGFDWDNADKGLGLKSIQSRVDFLNGQLAYDTQKQKGTIVTVEVPITDQLVA